MMPVRALIAVAAIAGLKAAPLSAQAPAPASSPVRLVRCAAGADLPCLVTRVTLDGRDAAAVAQLDSASEARAWTGDLGGRRLAGPGVVVSRQVDPPLRLLILLDRSGSMLGEGIAFTRITLKGFINALDSGSVRVAVAGFESRGVDRGIQDARFVAPAEAVRQLAALPVPEAPANTALYSALVSGGRAVSAAVAAAPGTRGAILLVTDGVNDVGRARDDAGLLSGPTGLADAAAAAEANGHRIWIMGVGRGVAGEELRTLAGSHGSVAIAALDPNAMAERLSSILRELRGGRDLTFGVRGGAAASTLARAPWTGTVAVWREGRPVITRALAWRPPLFALPAYEGVAAAGSLSPALRETVSAGAAPRGMRWLIAIVLGLLGGMLWLIVPRYVWGRQVRVGGPVDIAPAAARRKTTATAPARGLRSDVQEAPPRRPADVTGEFRVARG